MDFVNASYLIKNPSVVEVSGKDAKKFLHRLSTNAVDLPDTPKTSINCFVTQKGRLVDVVHQIINQDKIILIGCVKSALELITWLDQFLFIEDVVFQDISDNYQVAWLIAPSKLDLDGLICPSLPALGHNTYIACLPKTFVLKGRWLTEQEAENLRIAASLPWSKNEINDNYNPLDLNLQTAIHWHKGCYIGQEVISRLETYQKQSKHLVGLTCDEATFLTLKPGCSIQGGVVTSVASNWHSTLPCALIIVKQLG